ncbi:DMT family transporter [Bowmanella sp. Y26]|uniref:DMT family transporter n=1 Tax=Bowmanella yangjiangensis TaxID=2811230 RepID=A0ABS3CST0_9ALTE|nr:DMT family transporter [Bowmanella yangjiangensis]MBN7820174.1 DMT family transporter [Bowmanella yangjiangensis]MBT1065357.1 DMT family transporter [Bowmanella yangjiangensis]
MRSPMLLGALSLILAEALFAGVGALVKHLSDSLNQSQLVFFRNLFALVFLLPWLCKVGPQGLKTEHFGLHLLRSTSGLLGMYCFFYVLANLPLAQAMMALLVAPFIVPIIAYFWLKERISQKSLMAIGLGFIGCAFVLRPESGGWNIFVLLALCCATFVAFTKCTIRKLSDSEPSGRIVFYFTGLATLVSFFPLLANWQPMPNAAWPWLLLMGLMAAIGQLLMTKAFQLASPVRIGLLTYSSVLFAAFLGYWFWQEPVSAGLLAGTLLIIWAANLTIRQRWLW